MNYNVVLIDDDLDLLEALKQSLELNDYQVLATDDPEMAIGAISRDSNCVVISDILMPKHNGIEVLERLQAIDRALPVVLITGNADVPMAVEAMRAGAYEFVEKPFAVQTLLSVVSRAMEKRRLVLENRELREFLQNASDLDARLVGRNPAIVQIKAQIKALSDVAVDVMIIGETGTGKEVVARALHDFCNETNGAFVAINCAAIPADILESELFGHEAGAFTGAIKAKAGKLETAANGTVFLDELESLPLELQAKLLRVIETRRATRLGSNQEYALNVRFIAACKADYASQPDHAVMRTDLYYRLNVVTLALPTLAERKDDLPLLFAHLSREARAKYRRDIPPLTPQLEQFLMQHNWPGNVRELRNTAERFVLGLWQPDTTSSDEPLGTLAERVNQFEKHVIETVLDANNGEMKATYEMLGLSRKGLYDKIKRLGITR
ncbi:MAG: sigma-54-dependent Fis family transcriptional regulator [Gammaproteobacteria bacterium]|nr:sigma-54-dependent Fis family transcriptional regulator [Gammaproteobacteria bacterium]